MLYYALLCALGVVERGRSGGARSERWSFRLTDVGKAVFGAPEVQIQKASGSEKCLTIQPNHEILLYLDAADGPAVTTLRQCVGSDPKAFSSGCRFLATMLANGRVEAGVFLLGLLRYYQDELSMLGVVVESLGASRDARCVAALFGELRRVPSSNTTRRYLDTVITTLRRMPADMVQEQFLELAGDSAFSYRMRAKFRAVAEAAGRRW